MRTGTAPLFGLVTLLLLPLEVFGQVNVPGVTVEKSHEYLGPFEITGGTVHVDLRLERLRSDSCQLALDETTLVVGFMDRDGDWLCRRPLPNRITSEGYDRCFRVSAKPLDLTDGCVLGVWYEVVPPGPGQGRMLRLFGWRGGEFGPLGTGITGPGTFAQLPVGEAPESVKLIAGTLPFHARVGPFAVRVPLRVDLADLGVRAAAPWRLAGDAPELYVGELALTGLPTPVVAPAGEVMLYETPQGGVGRRTVVGPDSEVGLGPAYGRVRLVVHPLGQRVTVEVEVERVHVTVDGREGWSADYEALGRPVVRGGG